MPTDATTALPVCQWADPYTATNARSSYSYVVGRLMLDLSTQHPVEKESAAALNRDLDETRQLLYAINMTGKMAREDRFLGGTVVNALVHHRLRVDPAEATAHVPAALKSGDAPANRWSMIRSRKSTDGSARADR